MRPTHVVEQLSFAMIPSILTFEFDLILGAIFDFLEPQLAIFGVIFNFFGALMSYFWGLDTVQELFWGLLM